jgi:hypothetical protein
MFRELCGEYVSSENLSQGCGEHCGNKSVEKETPSWGSCGFKRRMEMEFRFPQE